MSQLLQRLTSTDDAAVFTVLGAIVAAWVFGVLAGRRPR